MNRAKLVALLLISFIATSSVIYQIRNRKPSQGVVVGSAPEPKPPVRGAPSPASAITVTARTNVGTAQQNRGPALNVPATEWGRNPFLTPQEINKLNQPDVPVAVATPVPKPPVEPLSLPAYSVTGIISGDQGKWAIVDGRLVRPGEQIGTETVKEVKDRGIVLEHDGQTRELPLKKIEDTVAAAPPKKEVKP